MMAVCYLGLGSNLGDRRRNIKMAIQKINALKQTKVVKSSRLIETAPVGGPAGQRNFLNAAVKIRTSLTPARLLRKIQGIEKELGRRRTLRFGPRTIDLDILFYEDKVIRTKTLGIPHPRLFEREFVLRPLSEVI